MHKPPLNYEVCYNYILKLLIWSISPLSFIKCYNKPFVFSSCSINQKGKLVNSFVKEKRVWSLCRRSSIVQKCCRWEVSNTSNSHKLGYFGQIRLEKLNLEVFVKSSSGGVGVEGYYFYLPYLLSLLISFFQKKNGRIV